MSLAGEGLWQCVADVDVLQAQVASVAQPVGGGAVVVAVVAIGESRIGGRGVFVGRDAQLRCRLCVDVSVVDHALEDLSVVVVAEGIDAHAVDEERRFASALEVQVHVEVLVGHRNAKTIDEVLSEDSDDDGLTDVFEKSIGTDPTLKDTDEDGLSDYEEVNVTQTNPSMADTNGNGTNDGADDEDGDKLANREEIDGGTNPLAADSDNDRLDDYVEKNTYGSDPLAVDTDSDTIDDGKEVELGLSPVKAMTDGVTPDAERKFDQTITNDTANCSPI